MSRQTSHSDESSNVNVKRQQIGPHQLHSNVLMMGYLKLICQDDEDKLIPSDIVLVCGDFYGHSPCCILSAMREQPMDVQSTDEEYEVNGNFVSFLEIDHLTHSLYIIRPENINLTNALFTSIINHHNSCYEQLMNMKKWVNPILKYRRYWHNDRYSPLHIACKVYNIQCVKQIIQDPSTNIDEATHKGYRGETPLQIAFDNEHYDIMKLLIKTKRVNVDITNDEGLSPLFCAARDNEIEFIQLLIQNNVCLYLYKLCTKIYHIQNI